MLEELYKGQLTEAWTFAVLDRMGQGKNFPKRADELWDERAGDQTVEQLKMLALAWAKNGSEIRKQMQKK